MQQKLLIKLKQWGWVFGIVVKMLLGIPTICVGMPGFESAPSSSISPNVYSRTQQVNQPIGDLSQYVSLPFK